MTQPFFLQSTASGISLDFGTYADPDPVVINFLEPEYKSKNSLEDCKNVKKELVYVRLSFLNYTVELQWPEHIWNHEIMFETEVVRANDC